MPMSGTALLIAALAGIAIWGGSAVVHGVKAGVVKTKHAIVHVVHPHREKNK